MLLRSYICLSAKSQCYRRRYVIICLFVCLFFVECLYVKLLEKDREKKNKREEETA